MSRLLAAALTVSGLIAACGGDDDESSSGKKDAAIESGKGGSGTGGATGGSGGTGASTGGGGTGGGSGGAVGGGAGGGAGVSGGSGGSTGGTGGGTGGGSTADGGQPIGSLCVNDSNCSQATGTTICCALPGCVAPCECQLEANCPGGSPFLPCQTGADCNKYGGGKVCCETQTGGSTMRFCTKPNGCNGKIIP